MYSAYLLIQTKFGKAADVVSALKEFEEVSNVDSVYGRHDLVVKVEVETPKSLELFLKNKILTIEDIQSNETLIIEHSEELEIDEE